MAISNWIASLTTDRDALAAQIRDVLNEASFGDHDPSPSEVADLTWQAKTLLMRPHELGAAGSR